MGAIQKILDEWGDETVKLIQANLARSGTNASGKTSKSLRHQATDNKIQITGREFFNTVETGRRPGKRPPTGPIEQWLRAKNVSLEGKISQVAFAISKVIGEKGTQLYQNGGRKDIITPAFSDKRIDELSAKVADEYFKKTVIVVENGITGDN